MSINLLENPLCITPGVARISKKVGQFFQSNARAHFDPIDLTIIMAKRVSLKLPPFNLTKRSTSGKVVHQFIPRGCTHTNRTVIEENVCSSGTGMHHEVGFQDIPPENLPTLHEVYQKQAA